MEDLPSDDVVAAQLLAGLSTLDVGSAATSSDLSVRFARLDPVATAATFGGLLAIPELQANCIRLEMLVHLALLQCNGRKNPRRDDIASAFGRLGEGLCGRMEDPAEDVFASSLATKQGNFRVIEGVWESAGFYLQRVLNALDPFEGSPIHEPVVRRCRALLQLSNLVCHRAGVERNILGAAIPAKGLSDSLCSRLKSVRELVRFTRDDLTQAGIDRDDLLPFLFDPAQRSALSSEALGDSLLERHPVAWQNDEFHLILPTAVSAAIRRYVIEAVEASHLREPFLESLALEYGRLFSGTPLLGSSARPEIEFKRTEHAILAGISQEIDAGRFLNIVFMLDTIEDFEVSGLAGIQSISAGTTSDIQRWIATTADRAVQTARYRSGITLLVGCGVGRGVTGPRVDVHHPSWQVKFVSAPTLATLSWARDVSPLTLWRLEEGQEKLRVLGVELRNIHGPLNLLAWARSLDGHLLPHADIPDDVAPGGKLVVYTDQTALREARHEVATSWDPHVERDDCGQWIRVRREGRPFVPPRDPRHRIYATEGLSAANGPRALVITGPRTWWSEVRITGAQRKAGYDRWKTVAIWLARAAAVLEDRLDDLPPGPIVWIASFEPARSEDETSAPLILSFDECRAGIVVDCDRAKGIVRTLANLKFEQAIFNAENVAERALVDAFVEGVLRLGRSSLSKDEIVTLIVPDASARHSHAFMAQGFRDFVQHKLPDTHIGIDDVDLSTLKLGLGWQVRDRAAGPKLEGKNECTQFLNLLVAHLEEELCKTLRGLDRRATLRGLLRNHESAAVERNNWRKTSAALLSLSDDGAATLQAISNHDHELNAVALASRLALEFALCECPLEGGSVPGKLEISKLLAIASTTFHFGGWSDAIRWDVMKPSMRVTPFGDVHGHLGFVDEVIQPFGRQTHGERVERDIEDYAENLEERSVRPMVADAFDPEFLAAWEAQFGASLDEARQLVDIIENRGIRDETAILALPRSEILQLLCGTEGLSRRTAAALLDYLTLPTRPRWRDMPAGFDEFDRHPWRFRRRLSVLRRPFLQVNTESDSLLVVAPGMLRDALSYMVGGYFRGDFPHKQLHPLMAKWAGRITREKGAKFSAEVANRLRELGWRAQTEVRVTKILARSFDQDFGDVDVLAWNPISGRVLMIECKDLQYRKTYGEIAEQLADYRGEMRADGKPDDLRRHLNRVEIISQHSAAVARYLAMESITSLESHLVFKNPVPVTFALARMIEKVRVHTLKEVGRI